MISFIIPTLNEEKTLRQTLEAISLYQGEKEIIISDGNSRDATLKIAKEFTDKIFVYHGEKRQTIGQGRNDGAKLASGEILVFVDADVIIPDINAFFQKAFAIFTQRERLVALTVEYKVLPEMATWLDKIIFKLVAWDFVLANNYFKRGSSGGEFQMIKAEAFKKVGGFNERLAVAEDNELFYRLSRIGETRCDMSLFIFHTGRRAHKIGWPRLLLQWWVNYLSVFLFNKSVSQEWKEIR